MIDLFKPSLGYLSPEQWRWLVGVAMRFMQSGSPPSRAIIAKSQSVILTDSLPVTTSGPFDLRAHLSARISSDLTGQPQILHSVALMRCENAVFANQYEIGLSLDPVWSARTKMRAASMGLAEIERIMGAFFGIGDERQATISYTFYRGMGPEITEALSDFPE